ncbi:hypothetical protein TCAL_03373 [Tigriopus californicus]|uniref:glutathione transferase n=1 Tax=Tigriopus californicus TaxID=6832 RepID=A0A553P1A6_TIGCA|nr:glutathione S-transferase-like [Tigriopus californicus]TRY71467.1 hypothetical protein TCAL_03373 [Tigriopus californicus]
MAPKIKLVYFPLRGRAELIRLVLAAGETDYEEDIIEFQDWPDRKADMMFESLPMLTWDGEEVGQSLTIARFVAKKLDLAGRNDLEQARADAIVEHTTDLFEKYYGIRYCEDEIRKQANIEAFKDKHMVSFLQVANKLLERQGGEYFTGHGMSYGDLAVYMGLQFLNNTEELQSAGMGDIQKDILAKMQAFPKLLSLIPRVENYGRVAEYLKNRPEYPH